MRLDLQAQRRSIPSISQAREQVGSSQRLRSSSIVLQPELAYAVPETPECSHLTGITHVV